MNVFSLVQTWAKRLHRAFNGCSIKSIHLFFTVSGGTVNLI